MTAAEIMPPLRMNLIECISQENCYPNPKNLTLEGIYRQSHEHSFRPGA